MSPTSPTAIPTRPSHAGRIVRGAERQGDLVLGCDVVIIGTGAGGAIAAKVLAERGLDVICLEEGPHITAREHGAMRPSESLRHVWRDGGMTVAVGLGDTPVINVTMGKVVGGSSMVTGGVCLRPPEEVIHRWVHELGLGDLDLSHLDRHLSIVERLVGVEAVPPSMRSRAVQRFGEGLARKGGELVSLERNTHGCQGESRCNFGCPHQAKLSVDLSVLPRAVEHGATIVSDALVEKIRLRGRRAVGVEGRLGRGHRFVVHADTVVLAAGAWHDPVVLARSGIRHPDLGRHMTLHPSFRMMARFDEPVRGWEGALQSAYSPSFMKDGHTMVALFVPPGVVAGAMPGIGPELALRTDALQHIAIMGGLLHDEGGGRVWPVPAALGREPVVTYRMAKADRARLPEAVRRMAEIYFEAGARECFSPVLGLGPITPERLKTIDFTKVPGRRYECTSQHPLGTCRMGTDPKRAVVSPEGRVWDVAGLWVADGSIVPTSLGVNPQITVMAMAHRVAERVADAVSSSRSRRPLDPAAAGSR